MKGRLAYAAVEAGAIPVALSLLRSLPRIDLLITDMGLPGGMNGRQNADAARLERLGSKVLFITGFAENAAVRNASLNLAWKCSSSHSRWLRWAAAFAS